jgi:hypothetical protein
LRDHFPYDTLVGVRVLRDLDNENLQVIKSLLTASAKQDWQAAGRHYTRDVKVHFPGRNKFSGDYTGLDGVSQLLTALWEWTDGTLASDMHDILANDQHGVMMYTVTAKRGDRAISYRYIDVYHFREKLVSEVWGQPVGDVAEFDAFYSE